MKKGNKEIRVIFMSGKEIRLKETVNINTEILSNLYNKIQIETNKLNISGIIINKYLYTHKNYTENCWGSLVDISNNHDFSVKSNLIFKFRYVSELLNEDYNEDYIKVSLILGSYMHP